MVGRKPMPYFKREAASTDCIVRPYVRISDMTFIDLLSPPTNTTLEIYPMLNELLGLSMIECSIID